MAPQTHKIKDPLQTDEDEPEEVDEEGHRGPGADSKKACGEDQTEQ